MIIQRSHTVLYDVKLHYTVFYFFQDVYLKDNELIIDFILPWTNHIYIEYTSSCQWPIIVSPSASTHFAINIKGISWQVSHHLDFGFFLRCSPSTFVLI